MKLSIVLAMSLLFATVAFVPTANAEVGCGDGSVVNKVQYCANEAIDLAQEEAEDAFNEVERIFCALVCNNPLLP